MTMIGKKALREEVLPFNVPEREITACEHARFHLGPGDSVIVEETTHGRRMSWRIRLVEIGEDYDADWNFIGCYEHELRHSGKLFCVLVKRA